MGKLNMTHFAVADISSVCRVIVEEAGKCTIPEAKSHETYTTFAANHTDYQGSLTRDKSSESSPKVVLADTRRDRAASGIFRVVDGLTYSPNPDIARKAETLSLRLRECVHRPLFFLRRIHFAHRIFRNELLLFGVTENQMQCAVLM